MKKTFILFIVSMVLVTSFQIARAIYYAPGVDYQSHVSGGYGSFTTGFNATGIGWVSDLIIWSNFNMSGVLFGDFGFEVPAGLNASITKVHTDNVTIIFTHTSSAVFRLYVPQRGIPVDCTADVWGWNGHTKCIEIYVKSSGTVVVSWTGYHYYEEEDEYQEPSGSPSDFLTLYLDVGDFSGFVISSYTESMGVTFFALVLLMMSIPIYMNVGLFPTVGIWIAFWGSWNVLLPPQGINIAFIILVLTIGIMIAYLFLSRRGPYAS